MHTYNDEKESIWKTVEHFKEYDHREFQSIWFYSRIQFWKKRDYKVLNSAHDYSY